MHYLYDKIKTLKTSLLLIVVFRAYSRLGLYNPQSQCPNFRL